MKTIPEWILGLFGTIIGLALSVWGGRAIVYKIIEERSVGKTAVKILKEELEKFRKEIFEQQITERRMELEIEALKKQSNRTDKFVDNNYEDLKELDDKVEKMRRVQDSKIL